VSFDAAPVTVRTPVSLELTRGASSTVTAPLYRDGAAVTATAAAARLYSSGGALLDSEASALTGGVATWTLTPATTLPLEPGYRIEWDITHAGGIARHTVSVAIVRRALYPVITDEDIIRRDRTLDASEAGYRGPESLTDLQEYIDEAWTEILGRIWGQGSRPALVMSPEALRSVHLYLSLAIIYRAMGSDRMEMAAEYQAMYEAAWASLRWVYDSDDDGVPDDDGQRQAGPSVLWLC
jgi:hypothetical protein